MNKDIINLPLWLSWFLWALFVILAITYIFVTIFALRPTHKRLLTRPIHYNPILMLVQDNWTSRSKSIPFLFCHPLARTSFVMRWCSRILVHLLVLFHQM